MEETDPMFVNQPISPTRDIATTTTSNHSNGPSQPTTEIKQERLDEQNTPVTGNEKTNNHQDINHFTPSSNASIERAVDWREKTSSVKTPISSSSN